MKLLGLLALLVGSLSAVTAQCEGIAAGPNCLSGCSFCCANSGLPADQVGPCRMDCRGNCE
ncbi:hypothetical protein SISSUDRAFT_1042529, partial [Sistotremastrum suecicum HHB10207 ss-3]